MTSRAVLGGTMLFVCPLAAIAVDIEGVQVASMDQPRVTVTLRRTPEGEPLSAKADQGLAKMLGLDAPDRVESFAAFLDTGASGISISTQTADQLGIKRLAAGTKDIVFHDVGVGGTDEFAVAEPLFFALGPYQALGTVGGASFGLAGGPWSAQIGPLGGGGLLGQMIGGIDVVGMPAMVGKIVVIDARPVNTFSDTLKVQVITPQAGEAPRLPQVHRTVLLSYSDFTKFTRVEPANAQRPVTIANPFLGPAPMLPADPRLPKPPVISYKGKSTKGAWLLDTGAAASMISKRMAADLGVKYKEGSEGTGNPVLEGVDRGKQFSLTVGGIGGSKKAAGFYIDELRIPTADGDDLVYKPAPVLVLDISLEHPETGETVTLDGIFGMNFLVASAQITEGLAPDIGGMVEGPFDWIVVDHTRGTLGVTLRKELLP